jgi:hypothetical protein
MKLLRALLFVVLTLLAITPAEAQIGVQISLKRRLFIAHEPVIATVTLTNTSGRELALEDTPQLQWFGFQINGTGESIVPPRNPDYGLDSVVMQPGETVRKSVNLNELYALGDLGALKVRATIYLATAKRYFTSRPVQIEITEGRVLSRQAAGVPEGLVNSGSIHMFTLLTHFQDEGRILYVRIQDRDDGRVFGTYPLGRLIDGAPPQAEFDTANNLYILHLIGKQAWVLTKIGVNGEFMGQTSYNAAKSRPTLRKLADGKLQIVGGRKEAPIAQVPTAPPVKLSDRPPGLPR